MVGRGLVAGWVVFLVGTGGIAMGAETAGWGDRLFAERAHDFGNVARGATVRHNFVLTNTLNEPISILGLRPSCGCTSGRSDVAVVPPGGRANIEAAMDTTNFVGRKVTTLFVSLTTNSGQSQEVGLGVSSTILSDVVLNPGTIDFGVVTRGQAPTRMIQIDRVDSPGWQIAKLLSSSKVIEAQVDETSRTAYSAQYRLTVRLKPDAAAGPIRDELLLQTNDPRSPVIPVLMTGHVVGELSASPASIALGRIAASGTAQGRYLVKASKPFKIVGIEGNTEGFELIDVEPGSSKPLHVLQLTYKAGANGMRGDLRPNFRVTTDLPGEAPVNLAASLYVNP